MFIAVVVTRGAIVVELAARVVVLGAVLDVGDNGVVLILEQVPPVHCPGSPSAEQLAPSRACPEVTHCSLKHKPPSWHSPA